MIRPVIASILTATALTVGCAATAPQASPSPIIQTPAAPRLDPLTAAINAQSGIPGMVTFLNTLRTLGELTSVPQVPNAVESGGHYCDPTQEDFDLFSVSTPVEFRAAVDAYFDSVYTPTKSAAIKAAMNTLCAA